MYKMIKVSKDTHEQAKEQAKEKGMTLQGYIKTLVSRDIKKIDKGIYR